MKNLFIKPQALVSTFETRQGKFAVVTRYNPTNNEVIKDKVWSLITDSSYKRLATLIGKE